MRYKLRPFQKRLVSDVVADLSRPTKDLNEVVLAACPGAGKTIMSIEVIHRMLASKKVRRVLVLAHATTLLRSQYASRLEAAGAPFKFGEYLPREARSHVAIDKMDASVVVGLPQSLVRVKDLGSFDLVVVDEAHLYYGAKMMSGIINRVGARRILLLTGTPSPFVARGIKLHAATMQEIYLDGKKATDGPWIADSRIKLLESRYDVSRRQYNEDGEIGRSVRFLNWQTKETLGDLLRWCQLHYGKSMRWRGILKRMGKTLIVCRSQKIAKQTHDYFEKSGIPSVVSTSDVDAGSERFEYFKRDPGLQILVVVARANVGFDFPQLGALIDMTGTINIDRIFQLFARTVRPYGKAEKLFVKLASKDMFAYTKAIVNASLSLQGRQVYETWNGKNLIGMSIPSEACEATDAVGASGRSRYDKSRTPPPDDGFLAFGDFMTTHILPDGRLIGGTTIGEISEKLGISVLDPDRRRLELLEFYAKENRPVPYHHPYYDRQRKLAKDHAVKAEQIRVGWPTRTRRRRLELIGRRFNRLTVLARNSGSTWLCKCDCGNTRIAVGGALTAGACISCGCAKYADLTGQRFGRLTAIKVSSRPRPGIVVWSCRCRCGKTIDVKAVRLKTHTRWHCGCISRRELYASNGRGAYDPKETTK